MAGQSDIRVALVFGSRARGMALAHSDVDLAVLGRAVDLLDLGARVSLATGFEADVVSIEDAGVPLLDQILRYGVVVHEGVPHAAATWRGRALATLETDRSWYAVMQNAMLKRLAASTAG